MTWKTIISARLAIGMIVLITAEIFSGATLKSGVWHPFVWLLTYWLYFAHFFFFTTLAIITGRRSLSSLYLWGVLFGLYESWITKVIWQGYDHNFKPLLGYVGPYAYAEMSMPLIFHPLMSFILPLAVACVLCPSLRREFPDLAWLTGTTKWAHRLQWYLVVCFGIVMAVNSGGTVNLAVNLAICLIVLRMLLNMAQPALDSDAARKIVVFSGWGRICLCAYLVLLYGVTYFKLLPEGLPSAGVQVLTLGFYALVIAGLWLHRPENAAEEIPLADPSELRRIKRQFALLLVGALLLSLLSELFVVKLLAVINFVLWTPAGAILLLLSIFAGWKQYRNSKNTLQ